jgi:hypothetical protein
MNRQEAIEKGVLVYTTGKKCPKHPNSPRRVSNGNCHECICERMRSPHSRRLLKERKARKLSAQKKTPSNNARGKSTERQTRGGVTDAR